MPFSWLTFWTPKILTKKYLDAVARATFEVTKMPQYGTIHLIAASPAEIQKINKKTRNIDSPTDILTFSYYTSDRVSMYTPPTSSSVIWEIYLCPEKIQLYAEERWNAYEDQLRYIVIHWLLHLLGYDHETPKDLEHMHALEDEIVKKVF